MRSEHFQLLSLVAPGGSCQEWGATPLLPGGLRDKPGLAEVTQLVDAELALGRGHWSLQKTRDSPLSSHCPPAKMPL